MDAFVVDVLAGFRLTRLITEDTFPPVKRAREWIWQHWPPVGHYLDDPEWKLTSQETATRWWKLLGFDICTDVTVTAHGTQAVVTEAHPIGELIGCPWCLGMHVAIGVTLARRYAPALWDPLARALATSAVTGVIASHT